MIMTVAEYIRLVAVISVFNEYTFADGTPFGIKEE